MFKYSLMNVIKVLINYLYFNIKEKEDLVRHPKVPLNSNYLPLFSFFFSLKYIQNIGIIIIVCKTIVKVNGP